MSDLSSPIAAEAEHKNPFAVRTSGTESDSGWQDGNLWFTQKEIRTTGDVILPRLCWQTGSAEQLVRQERRCRPMDWPGQVAFFSLLILMGIGMALRESIGALRALPEFARLTPLLLLLPAVAICWWRRVTVPVVWFTSEVYLRRLSRRRRWCAIGAAAGLLTFLTFGLCWTVVPWWLTERGASQIDPVFRMRIFQAWMPLFGLVAYGSTFLVFGCLVGMIENRPSVTIDRDGTFRIRQVPESFMLAWAAEVDARVPGAANQGIDIPHS